MENYDGENIRSAATPTVHQFTFKNRLCVFCALPLDFLQEEQIDSLSILNEDIFKEGVAILCEALSLKDGIYDLFGDGSDNWRLLGIDNFVQWICCETCYHLVSELVSLQQLIVKSQISLKENARKLENFVVVSSQAHHQQTDDSEAPSLEYSVNACVLLREEILNNFSKKDKCPPQSKGENVLSGKQRSLQCPKQAVVLLKRLEISSIPIKPEITGDLPLSSEGDDEFISPFPLSLKATEADEDTNEEDEDQKCQPIKRRRTCPSPSSPPTMETDEDADVKDDQEYQPIKKRRRRRPTGRKKGRPRKPKPLKIARKPGRPRKVHQDQPPSSSSTVATKRKRNRKPAFCLIEEGDSQLENEDEKKPATIPSTKGGRALIIGSRHYRFLHEGTGPKLHAIYFLSTSPSPSDNDMVTYLMMYNVKFSKTSTSIQCLHPECSHQEPLTGYFTDQTILRNMRFHIRFAHRFFPKKDKTEEDKPSFYYCHSCESQIDSKLSFLEHRRQLHAEEAQLPPFCFCEVCGDPNVALGDLVQHVFSHKSELEKDEILKKGVGRDKDIMRPMTHPCDQCDKCFKCHTELMTHRCIHMPSELKLKFVCEICGRGCRSAPAVENHKRRVHFRDLPVEYECHVCGKGFLRGQKESWEVHLNMHTGEKPYQCEQCGKRFVKKWYLTKHVRLLHIGEKDKVSCEFCGKIYKTDDYLRKHCLKKHRDKVKIKREILGEEDKDKYKPLEQREGFIGPKLMFPCEPCGKVFIFKSMLITHLKNRHKMFYERKEDYPQQITLEDSSAIEAGTRLDHQ